MSTFSSDSLNRLLQLQKQELEALTEIFILAKNQSPIIEDEDTEKLNRNLDSRQEIIYSIDRLHQELDVLMQSYTSAASKMPRDIQSTVTGFSDRINEKLREIAEKDAQNREAVKSKMGEYIDEAKKLNLGRKGLSAYNQTDYQIGSGYFDEKK